MQDKDLRQFESRKQDHIRLALDPSCEAFGFSGLDHIELTHEALPDLDFADIDLGVHSLGMSFKTPIFISSMTAGHGDSLRINQILAEASVERDCLMGVGSQRRELTDFDSKDEWKQLRKFAPRAKLAGNLGIAQVISHSSEDICRILDGLEACALFVHLNPLQEALQPEGTPQFKGGIKALENLISKLKVPVIVKEVGCGMSEYTIRRLVSIGVAAVDVSGKGGTHWGRIETGRLIEESLAYKAGKTFSNWGVSTVDSVINALEVEGNFERWASGGVRSGVDVAKLLALGADMVGIAKPYLEAAILGEKALHEKMDQFALELKIAMFCTGTVNPLELKRKKVWQWNKVISRQLANR